jgi:hypothetical protein
MRGPGSNFDRQLKMDSTTRLHEFDERREHRKNVLDKLAPHLRRKWGSKLAGGGGSRSEAGSSGEASDAAGTAQKKFLEKYGLGETAFTADWRVPSR